MTLLVVIIVVTVVLLLLAALLAIHVVNQYESGVVFRLGRVTGIKPPGLAVIIPVIDRLHKVSMRIITMPIQSQGQRQRGHFSRRLFSFDGCCEVSWGH
ncbi:hypothetical protein ART_0356 [Arthrobacter sp. PAMC 25486]|nr:SPFH domain-containing protein [Arthrobacter sp. PAMC 25486]AIX99954.1 hypothetical protein ART_0356 [Arthrobacter sp. PAMC 25486]